MTSIHFFLASSLLAAWWLEKGVREERGKGDN
jgi:hypothetical protein